MRMMMVALAAVLFAAPLAAQPGEPAAASGAWMRMPILDARLRVELASAPGKGAGAAEWRSRLSAPQWGLLGAAAGCLTGALVMSTAREGEVAAQRFNGCILGGAAGGFLGGVYGLLTGG